MDTAAPSGSPLFRRGAGAFTVTVLRAVTWRAILVTQTLGLMFAVFPWLEQWHQPTQPRLLVSVLSQAITALLVMLAAFAGDESVRRGWHVWRAFAVVALCASGANVLAQWLLSCALSAGSPEHSWLEILNDFLSVGGVWGTALMVFLNRRAAQRLLTRLRAGELERVQAEQRLLASRLAAAEAQIDPSALLRQLAGVRNLYATGQVGAEEQFEALITGLRETVARGATAQAREVFP